MVGPTTLRLPALAAWPIVLASLRLFRRAPRASVALWLLSTAAGLLLDTLGTPKLLASAQREASAGGLVVGCGAVLAGWAASCTAQSLWAQLVFEAHQPQGVASLAHAWRNLGGAWTRLGLLGTYAVGATLALYWPLVARQLQQLPTTMAAVATTAGILMVASVLATWLGLRLSLMVPAAAMHSLSTWAAAAASWRLTRGRLSPLLRTSALVALPSLALGLARTLLPSSQGSGPDVALQAAQIGAGSALAAALPLFTLIAEAPASGEGRRGWRSAEK